MVSERYYDDRSYNIEDAIANKIDIEVCMDRLESALKALISQNKFIRDAKEAYDIYVDRISKIPERRVAICYGMSRRHVRKTVKIVQKALEKLVGQDN